MTKHIPVPTQEQCQAGIVAARKAVERADGAKHTPATPLPWSQPSRYGNTMFELQRPVDEHTTVQGPILKNCTLQDAAYIAHAANAYPKLVEALREQLTAYMGDFGPDHVATRHYALLRSLGEE